MATFTLTQSRCTVCSAPVRVTEEFLAGVQRGEARNLCDSCFWREHRAAQLKKQGVRRAAGPEN